MADQQFRDSVLETIKAYYPLNRVTVGDDTSRVAREIADRMGAEVLSVPSGTDCLTWRVPPKWTARDAYIESPDGERVVGLDDSLLFLMSYSAPVSTVMARGELMEHVRTDEMRPACFQYDYRNQYAYTEEWTNWGFTIPYDVVQKMTAPEYRVVIDADFTDGSLDVVDLVVPGRKPETIFFAAHTCHPAQVNDGIACVAILLELFDWIKTLDDRRYSYRLIIGPEYFAAAALLAHGRDIDKLSYGVFLDMMGVEAPLGFQRSYAGDTRMDLAARTALASIPDSFERPFRRLYGNDEMFYDGPGFGIPTIGMGRAPFHEYHTDKDDLERCSLDRLEESYETLRTIVRAFEDDFVPVRRYRGPVQLSRYGLYIDPKIDPKGYDSLHDIQMLMDGERSCMDIAMALDVTYPFVRDFCAALRGVGLVEDAELATA